MTALSEGEYEHNSTDQLIGGDLGPGAGHSDAVPGDPVLHFLEDHGLSDMKEVILWSKLTLNHFKVVDAADLEALCSDLNLSSSQRIRLKHAVRTLQNNGNDDADDGNKPQAVPRAEAKSDKVCKLRSKIVIVGEAAVGKTTLQKAIMGWQFEEGAKATFAVSSVHRKMQYKLNEVEVAVDYEIIDTPGLDRFRDIITLYLRGALAVMVVYDVSAPATFLRAKWWVQYLEDHASGYDAVILIANKIDIADPTKTSAPTLNDDEESDGKREAVEEEAPGALLGGASTAGRSEDGLSGDIVTEGRMFATEHGIAFLEISAKYRDNVSVLTKWINKQSKLKLEREPQLMERKERCIRLHEPVAAQMAGKRFKCC